MPRDVVALVSADDFVSAVRVYADRVNDLLRRNGVPADEAIEFSETHALALLDAVVNAPATVIDLAGWWFARAIEVTSTGERTGEFAAVDEPISMLAGTAGEQQVREALATLPDAERAAVVLRDGYDLPPQAVGVALRRGAESAAELTAAGRLHLVAAYDDRRTPDLSAHSGRMTVDLLSLSRLAEGTLDSPRAAPLRRHASNCRACEDVLESLARGRRLAGGLPIIAMNDDAREALIDRVGSRAVAVLPSHEAVLRAVDEDHDPGPTISPVVAVIVLVLAVALGVAIAVLLHTDSSSSPKAVPTNFVAPTATPLFSVTPTVLAPPPTLSDSPSTKPTVSAPPSTAPPDTTSPLPTSGTTTAPPAFGPAAITLSPASGPSGSTITIHGTGWQPLTTVTVTYGHTGSTATATVNRHGRFTTTIQATGILPGSEEIAARDDTQAATAEFNQTL